MTTVSEQVTSTIAGVKHSSGETLVKIGAFGMHVVDGVRVAGSTTVTTFQFTQDAAQDALEMGSVFTWKISLFHGDNDYVSASDGNSVLDLRALNVHSLKELSIIQSGNATVLRGTDGQNFKIVLVGIQQAELGEENFIFA